MNLRWSFAPLVILCLAACTIDLGSLTRVEPLVESRVRGDSGPKLVMLEIEGVITDFERRSRLGSTRPSPVARARQALELAAEDDDVAGLVLRIQSPGGTVAASETLYHELMMWKQETNLPVVAYMQGIATSGGYYVAMAADRVIAHPATVTGSIGVIVTGLNVSALMERFGIEDQTLKSGEFKDAGSPLRPMRAEERAQLQSVLDDFHGRMTRKRAIPNIFAEPFQRRHFLFLGYSLGDWNLRVVLNHLRRSKDIPSWAIQHSPSPLEQRFWQDRGVEVYDMLLEEFVERLSQA